MPGKEPEGFHIKGEIVGGPFHPEATGFLIWHGIVSAIHLHDGKLTGIVSQPRFRILGKGRIELASLDQGFVGLGTGPYQNLTH